MKWNEIPTLLQLTSIKIPFNRELMPTTAGKGLLGFKVRLVINIIGPKKKKKIYIYFLPLPWFLNWVAIINTSLVRSYNQCIRQFTYFPWCPLFNNYNKGCHYCFKESRGGPHKLYENSRGITVVYPKILQKWNEIISELNL